MNSPQYANKAYNYVKEGLQDYAERGGFEKLGQYVNQRAGFTVVPQPAYVVPPGSGGANSPISPNFIATSSGDIGIVDGLGPRKLLALERELKVAEMTGGRSAVQARYKDGKLTLEDTPIKNSKGVSGIDVIGKNGELIQVGGPGKNANPDVLEKTQNAMYVLKEEARINNTVAKVYLEYGNSDRFKELVREAQKILGKDNVVVFRKKGQ